MPIQNQMPDWNFDKNVRTVLQEIEYYKTLAEREIKNNQTCHPAKIKFSCQAHLIKCKERYFALTGCLVE
jgi:hypothetical protein